MNRGSSGKELEGYVRGRHVLLKNLSSTLTYSFQLACMDAESFFGDIKIGNCKYFRQTFKLNICQYKVLYSVQS